MARALAARLQAQGLTTNVVLSFRPNERSGTVPVQRGLLQVHAAVHRVMRASWETASIGFSSSREERRIAQTLIRQLRPRTALSSLRMQQYILRLARAWETAARSADIAIFDQGFVQAVYSLASTTRSFNSEQLDRALGCLPRPDLLVRLKAPDDVLESRLVERQRRQNVLERLLEVDPAVNMASIQIFDRLDSILQARGFPITWLDSSGGSSVEALLGSLERAIESRGTHCARGETLH